MKTKPILFNTDMVQAILEGRKTQTRRTNNLDRINKRPDEWDCKGDFLDVGEWQFDDNVYMGHHPGIPDRQEWIAAPVQKGDVLWVRETWRLIGWEALDMIIEFKDGTKQWCDTHDPKGNGTWLDDQIYNLSEKGFIIPNEEDERWDVVKELPWKPSIFMPKEAARIFLRVTDVRVERLQDITEEDAIAEGVEKITLRDNTPCYKSYGHTQGYGNAVDSFYSLWESIHGESAWKENPWVWAYSFERIERPENF